MSTTTPTPPPAPEPDTAPRRRAGLPWPAVAAATVLATLAAVLVLIVLGDDDADPTPTATDTPVDGEAGELQLTPTDDAASGDPLDIAFTWPDGSESTIAAEVDGPTVVNFFASWCPPCIGEMPDLEAASQALGDRVHFLGLAVSDRPEDAERIVDQTEVTYDWGRDIRGDIAGAASVIQMPTTMFIAADGTIVDVHSGAVDEARLLALIEQHLGVTA